VNKITSDKTATDIFIDGASRGNPGESGIGILFINEENLDFKKYIGTGTNNNAEYTALITALEIALNSKLLNIKIHTDSLLVANQVNGSWKVKDPDIKALYLRAKSLIEKFEDFSITHVRREYNSEADRLANEAINEYFNK